MPLSYAKAPDLVPILTRTALSTRGEVQIDSRSNTLIVRDLPDRLTTVGELIKTLDRPQPQVEIEARIVQTTSAFARAIGVEWGINGRVDPALGNTTGLAFPNSGSAPRRRGSGAQARNADRRQPAALPAATSAIGIALGPGQRRAQSRLRPVAARVDGPRPPAVDAARVHAEQRGSRDDAGRPDSDSDGGEQHRDRHVQGRGAHAAVTPQITASNTIIMRIVPRERRADFSRA